MDNFFEDLDGWKLIFPISRHLARIGHGAIVMFLEVLIWKKFVLPALAVKRSCRREATELDMMSLVRTARTVLS